MDRESREGCGIFLIGVAIFAAIIALVYGIAAFNLSTWEPWARDKRTENIRNSNEYVDTQVTIINDAINETLQIERDIAYQRGLPQPNDELLQQYLRQLEYQVQRMCGAANEINDEYVPSAAFPYMTAAGCHTSDAQGGT